MRATARSSTSKQSTTVLLCCSIHCWVYLIIISTCRSLDTIVTKSHHIIAQLFNQNIFITLYVTTESKLQYTQYMYTSSDCNLWSK